MPESVPSHGFEAATPSLHPALYGTNAAPGTVPKILVCPLPLPGFPHEQLLPELSHELKTPLTGIMGLAQVLQRDVSAMADREHQYAALIYQKSQQLLVSINDLFDLAQLCTRQFVLQLRPIDLSSVVKTALKVAQHTTGSNLPTVISAHAAEEDSELWMMGDLSRVEQLLTHLIGYFAAQSLPGHDPVLKLRSHPTWLSISLVGALPAESIQTLTYLSEPDAFFNAGAAAMSGQSGAVLKFLLAQQLAQLHGGDVSWRRQSTEETEVTVLLPRDLTRATLFTRVGAAQPLFLIYAPLSCTPLVHAPLICSPLSIADDLAQKLHHQNVLTVVGRSLQEIQDKAKTLSPSVLVLEPRCVEAPEWPALEALLTEPSILNPWVIWLEEIPDHRDNRPIPVLDVWPLPLPPHQIEQTLKRLQTHRRQVSSLSSVVEVASTQPGGSAQPPRPLVVLQIDQVSASPPETRLVELLMHLSKDFGCTVLAADDLAQAELLAQIWQPKVMICPGTVPKWAMHLAEPSILAQIPLFWVDVEGCKTVPLPKGSLAKSYLVDRHISIHYAAQGLYQQLNEIAKETL